MPSLSDRLKLLGVSLGAQNLPPAKPRQVFPIEDVLPGYFCELAGGATYCVEERYDQEYYHGRVKPYLSAPLRTIAEWANEPEVASYPAESFVFLDTETSGLAGGTGTFAFLVGVGRMNAAGFQLKQYFMRDPLEEPALLMALEQYLAPCQAMVTFNGKSFDIPLLNTRYTLQGWKSPFRELAHIDLLHLSRRLWRERLPSRTLANLEVQVLETQRTDEEIPGWMIPQMYFDYLRDGDSRPMKRVFYHNAMDVLSMAALLNHTAEMMEREPVKDQVNTVHPVPPTDQAAIARLYEELGHTEKAIVWYNSSLTSGLPEGSFHDTLQRLSLLHKRLGDYASAIPLWQQAARAEQIYAFEELAKYYEHHADDLPAALQWTEQAIFLVSQPSYPRLERFQWIGALRHRADRLQRKWASKEK